MSFTDNSPETPVLSDYNGILILSDNVETDAVWNNSGVPYFIDGNILITNEDSLYIEAGNTFKFNGNYTIQAEGTLNCVGTESEHITFTSIQPTPNAGDWNYLYFFQADAGSGLTYCDIYYGGNSTAAVYINNCGSNVSLSHSSISNSNNDGIRMNNSHSSFINNVITDNASNGIYLTNACNPAFGSNSGEWNDIYNNTGYELYNGTADIDAKYIYWGTTTENDIAVEIYDNTDDANLGIVNYSSWMGGPNGNGIPATPENVQISIMYESINITWNSVTGATSYKVYSSNDPYSGFTEDLSGTFYGESWNSPLSNEKKFYYVKAVN